MNASSSASRLFAFCASALFLLSSGVSSAVTYFVNDVSTNGDVYCSTVGSDAHSGLSNSAPKLTITNLLVSYALAPGDVVYLDTGLYAGYTVVVTNSGTAADPIRFQGSTNVAAGGTILDRGGAFARVIALTNVAHLVFSDMTLRGGGEHGLSMLRTTNILAERMVAISNNNAFVAFSGAISSRLVRCISMRNSFGVSFIGSSQCSWDSGVLWSNTTHFFLDGSAFACGFSNSVMAGGNLTSGTLPAFMDTLVLWQVGLPSGFATMEDLHVFTSAFRRISWANPMLADPALGDFHPQSVQGRYNPITAAWVTDAVHSVLIDLGDPTRVFTNELSPRGTAINVGLYGNTREASLSRTNPWIYVASFNDGGNFTGTGTVWWSHGLTNGATVRVQYSPNDGATWTTLVSGVAASNRGVVVTSTGLVSGLAGLWRIQSESDTNVFDVNDTHFTLRQFPTNRLIAYVNDAVTNGDVYVSAPGSSTNSGVTVVQPRLTLQSVLDSYDFGPGDTIYIDTGFYTNTAQIVAADAGGAGTPLRLIGSTSVSGSVIQAGLSSPGLRLNGASFIAVSNLIIQSSQTGLDVLSSSSNIFGNLTFRRNPVGVSFNGGSASRMQSLVFDRNTLGLRVLSGSDLSLDHAAFWANTNHIDMGSSTISLTVSNSVLAGGVKAFAGTGQPSQSDYLLFWQVAFGGSFNNLYEYQRSLNVSWGSSFGDPQFVAPDGSNFQFRSLGGTFNPVGGVFFTDVVHSVAIDFGDPARAVGDETSLNGGRINIGPYGGTVRADRSITNAQLTALSLQDGGQLTVGDTIYWRSLNFPTGGLVRIEFSGDGGAFWSVVVSNLLASSGSYTWINTNFSSSSASRWRVVSQADPAVLNGTVTNFTLRNGPFKYYVNDDSVLGDMYCGAIGSDASSGTSSNSPKATLHGLLSGVDLEPGDIVYVDTGVYRSSTVPVWGLDDSGVATNPVFLVGSTNWVAGGGGFGTNWVAGGSLLDRQGGANGLLFTNASHVVVQGLVVTGGQIGVRIQNSTGIRLERVAARAQTDSGFVLVNATNISLSRVASYLQPSHGVRVEGNSGAQISQSVFWRNAGAGLRVLAGSVTISNSVIASASSRAPLYQVATPTNLQANFNGLWAESNAVVALIGAPDEKHDSLGSWSDRTQQDRRSLSVDPNFANPWSGDFHLKTQTAAGRYDPTLGAWVNDAVTSLLIDSGDPAAGFSAEPMPNGGRMDIGLYGNTGEASIGFAAPWLHAVTHAAGGVARGTSTLAWVAGNFTNNTRVRVDVSRDGGHTWSVVSNLALAATGQLTWDTSLFSNSPAGRWRIVSLSDTNVANATTNFFSIRNAPLSLYLNDAVVTGDVYTAAGGAATNWVASMTQPFDSLAGALSRYDLEPGDILYVDTGMFLDSTNALIGIRDGGWTGQLVRIMGTTNSSLGSVMDRGSTATGTVGLAIQDARWLDLSQLTFRGARIGVSVTNSSDLSLSVRAWANASNGVVVGGSTNISLRRSSAVENQGHGFALFASTNVQLDHVVSWSNAGSAVYLNAARANLTNSILTAHNFGRYIYEGVLTGDTVRTEHNNVLISPPAEAALLGGRGYRFKINIQNDLGLDVLSLSHDPRFADASAGDFHLQSAAGRWQPASGLVTDAVTSVLLDAGSPAYSVAGEPMPNGGRVNIGLYGGQSEASRSTGAGRLLTLTLNDGGAVRGTNHIYWMATGPVTGHLVYVDFSADGGVTWTNIATNLSASAAGHPWDTTVHPATLNGAWRITSQTDTSITARTGVPFSINNGALTYYVNDTNLLGDVYCSAAGNSLNDGASTSSPLPSISAVLSRYSLGPGDRIFVDTGVYGISGGLALDATIQGASTNRILIQGSTNAAFGGTVLDGLGGSNTLRVVGASGLHIRGLGLRNARVGIALIGGTNNLLDQVQVEGGRGFSGLSDGVNAIVVSGGTNTHFVNCVISGVTNGLGRGSGLALAAQTSAGWDGGVLWSNAVSVEMAAGAQLRVTNTSFSAFGDNSVVYSLASDAVIQSDYNNYHLNGGALLGRRTTFLAGGSLLPAPVIFDALPLWTRVTGNDVYSLSHDPQFANPEALDFRLSSQGGRWAPGVGVVVDAQTSPLLDAGSPASAFVNEPVPHGSRRDIGAFGNTPEASRTPTNSRLIAVSYNQSGVARGTNALLYWLQNGPVTGHLKHLDVSYDDGFAWFTIVSNLAVSSTSYVWNTTSFFTLPNIRWRVRSGSDPAVLDASDASITIRNSNIVYYVNDGSPTGDVYCSGVGSAANSGIQRGQPKASLDQVLAAYDIEPGDTIYIDTGVYERSGNCVYAQMDAGEGTNLVSLLGSTNVAAGGSRWLGGALTLDSTRSLLVQDLHFDLTGTVQNAGLIVSTASNTILRKVTVRGQVSQGVSVNGSFACTMERCAVVGASDVGLVSGSGSRALEWQHGVLWSNKVGIRATSGTNLVVANSVMAAFHSGQTVYEVSSGMTSTYNAIFTTNSALVAKLTIAGRPLPLSLETVTDWVSASGNDGVSLAVNPLMVSAPNDFHLLSVAGRFNPATTSFVNDAGTSLLIDAGDPVASFALETTNNGGRINIGLYGNTTEASRSPTQATVQAVSINDGGLVSGTNQMLYWITRGAATGMALRLQYSADSGLTWTNIVTNLAPGTVTYTWNTTNFESSVVGLWRIMLEGDTNTVDVSDRPFSLRNSPIRFYVNDASVTGDVYCSAVGHDGNLGTRTNLPMASLATVLSRYNLEPGDTVYVDTGVYTNATPIQFGQQDSGLSASNQYVTIQGSTNVKFGGTLLLGQGAASPVLNIFDVTGLAIRDVTVASALERAVKISSSSGLRLEYMTTRDSAFGIGIDFSSDIYGVGVICRNHSTNGLALAQTGLIHWDRGLFWSNKLTAVSLSLASLHISNSVFGLLSDTAVGYSLAFDPGTLTSDFNAFFVTNGGLVARQSFSPSSPSPFPRDWQTVSRWTRDTGRDLYSLAVNPRFVDEVGGNFQLRSQGGRLDVQTGGITNDAFTSPLIDAGAPGSVFDLEPEPNGGRVNIGPFGNHYLASRTPTQAMLHAVSLNDGGRAEGSAWPLVWNAQGQATSHTVRLEFTPGGTADVWQVVVSNLSARQTAPYLWNTMPYASSPLARWRIVSEVDSSVAATSQVRFALRNGPLSFFVNDANTSGDEFTTTVGAPHHTGTSSNQPRSEVQSILNDYDLEPGDTIYVDTGLYEYNSTNIVWGQYDAWDHSDDYTLLAAGQPSVTLQGSRNEGGGGAQLRGFLSSSVIDMFKAVGVSLRDITVRQSVPGAGGGVEWRQSHYASAERLRAYNCSRGIRMQGSDHTLLINCVLVGNTIAAVDNLQSQSTRILNSVIWSNTIGIQQFGEASDGVQVENSLLGVFGSGRYAYNKSSGFIDANYNHFHLKGGGFPAVVASGSTIGSGTGRLETLSHWIRSSGMDEHSPVEDALVAGANDYHPLSPRGRFVVGAGYITNIAEAISPLIDAGNPSRPFVLETVPNGSRSDIGGYANSSQSSLSPTNSRLVCITLNDGGHAVGLTHLHWNAGGNATGHTVRIEYSDDAGGSWLVLVTNYPAAFGMYPWDSLPYDRSAAGLWRITSENEPTVTDQTGKPFALRNGGGLRYYVNDASTLNDVYCASAGNDSNSGVVPGAPKLTLQNLLDVIDLEPGDIVYVDTGVYPLIAPVLIGDLDAGALTNRVIIQGSTNRVAGGTTFDRQSTSGNALHIQRTAGIECRDLRLVNAGRGVLLDEANDCWFFDVYAEECGLAAFSAQRSPTNYFVRCLARNSSVGISSENALVHWRNGVIWGASKPVNLINGGSVEVYNSVLRAVGTASRIYTLSDTAGFVRGNHNLFVREGDALFYEKSQLTGGNDLYPRLSDWIKASGQDAQSLTHGPQFADAVLGDFHPRSAAGRYTNGGVLTNDPPGVFSPLIDTGRPQDVWTNEPSPNGGRINIGLYGGSPTASRSDTNPWLLALSYNDGGVISGVVAISWVAGGVATSGNVRLEYALDGVDYSGFIASNVPANTLQHVWDVSALPISPFARWRVCHETYSGVCDVNDQSVLIKNTNLTIYVNDVSTNGDVYCYAQGSHTNLGQTPFAPLRDPADAVDKYYLGPGDIVYIDTGEYEFTNTSGITIGLVGIDQEVGVPGLPIRLMGSTNYAAGGSRLLLGSATNAILLHNTKYVDVEHITLAGGIGDGIVVNKSTAINLRSIRSSNYSRSGFKVAGQSEVMADRCVAHANTNYGVEIVGEGSISYHRGIVWSNGAGAVHVFSGSWEGQHTILGSTRTNTYLIRETGDNSESSGDYNFLFARNGARIGFNAPQQLAYSNLRAWQKHTAGEEHSAVLDPLLFSPDTGDFHLRSAAGRYDPGLSAFVQVDSDTSWAIDAGDPAAAYSAEPLPNGERLNVGLHGNSSEASLSVTNALQRDLRVFSLEDGGQVVTNIYLRWFSRGFSTSDTVRLDFSQDGGLTWQQIASNVAASAGQFYWMPVETNSTPVAYWRVSSEVGAPIQSTNSRYFSVRLRPVTYYVNDSSTNGDVYCTSPGQSSYDALTPDKPNNSVQAVLNLYDLEPGDRILVDSGYYLLSSAVLVLADDGGVVSNHVVIAGSTNWPIGVTTFDRQSTNLGSGLGTQIDAAFELNRAPYIELRNMVISNANGGVSVSRSPGLSMERVQIRDGGIYGLGIEESPGAQIREVVITRMLGNGVVVTTGDLLLDSSVIWSNGANALALVSATGYITNSILHARSTNYCYDLTFSRIMGDYNILYCEPGSIPARYSASGQPTVFLEALPQWTLFATQDYYSVSVDPLFANPANDDYHLQSPYGRFLPASNSFVSTDVALSYGVDGGPPTYPFDQELPPNGGWRNIGLFGNSQQASKSPTQAWVRAITASSGGRCLDTFFLTWRWGNMMSNTLVYLDYSFDGGTNWVGIASNILVSSGRHLWDSLSLPAKSPIARWRITVHGNTNVSDVTDQSFALNGPFGFYVNDTSTVADVYTSTIGSDANLGITTNDPKRTLASVLDLWDLEGGDWIYVDTGRYPMNTNDLFSLLTSDGGVEGQPVTIQGSTNGSALAWIGNPAQKPYLLTGIASDFRINNIGFDQGGLSINGSRIRVSSIWASNGVLRLAGSANVASSVALTLGELQTAGTNNQLISMSVRNGVITMDGKDISLVNSLVWGTSTQLMSVVGSGISLSNNTLVSSGTAVMLDGADASIRMRNNILVANGSERFVLNRLRGAYDSDYNNLVARNGAWFGRANGLWERLLYWQRESGQDPNSVSMDPLFADEAAGDFHLKSIQGRYTPAGVVTDAVHSPVIDLGDPLSAFDVEPSWNGGRLNLGAYGNTFQASRSRTNAWVLALVLNDGGVMRGTNLLRWTAGNLPDGATVTLRYSPDGGSTWTNIAAGLPAVPGQYLWDSTVLTNSSYRSLWGVVWDGNTNVFDHNDQFFGLRNSLLKFYVNDASTNQDVYTSSPGHATNDGRTVSSPMLSLASLLAAYDTEGGDVVYVDTGNYPSTNVTRFIWSRGGDALAGPLWIWGSTNFAAGGSVLTRGSYSNNAEILDIQASRVTVRNMTLAGSFLGARVESNAHVTIERSLIVSNAQGVATFGTSNVLIRNNRFWRNTNGAVQVLNSYNPSVENNTMVANRPWNISILNSLPASLQNNIFVISDTNAVAYTGVVNNVFIDYNVYDLAAPGARLLGSVTNLLVWQLTSQHDYRSNMTNPLLANVVGGDFHLRSQLGRWVDGFGWTTDTVNSWAIDRGRTNASFELEPTPNGGRLNIGAYGNTEFASKGLINTQVFLEVRTLNDATFISESNSVWPLIWTSINVPTAELFRVQFSGDGGTNWFTISNNVPAYQEFIVWNATPFYNTYKGRWRVVGVGDTNFMDINDAQFQLFFGTFMVSRVFFEENTNGIVFRGAWDEHYQVQWATNLITTNVVWFNAVTGPGPEDKASFLSTNGGDFVYRDIHSPTNRFRMYRVLRQQF